MRWHGNSLIKSSKYGNKSVTFAGEKFDSKRELARWLELKDLEKRRLISKLRRQVPYQIARAYKIQGKRAVQSKKYIADFVYVNNRGEQVVEDVKGYRTDVYRLKKHLMYTEHGIDIQEV